MNDTVADAAPRESASPLRLEWLAFVFVAMGLYGLYVGIVNTSFVLETLSTMARQRTGSLLEGGSPATAVVMWLPVVQCELAALLIVAGAVGVWLRRWYVLCLTASAAVCVLPPVGSVAGAFAFAVLLWPETRALFAGAERFAGSGWWGENVAASAKLLTGAFVLSAAFRLVFGVGLSAFQYVAEQQNGSPYDVLGQRREAQGPGILELVQQLGVPSLLALAGVGAALLLHYRKAPRSLMALSLLHASLFPLGTVVGVFALLWCQEPAHLATFPRAAKREEAGPVELTPDEEERFRKSLGMS